MHDFDQELTCTDLFVGVVATPIIFTAQKIRNEAKREALIVKDSARCVEQIYRRAGAGTAKGVAAGAAATLFSPLLVAFKFLASSKQSLENSIMLREINLEIEHAIHYKYR